MSRALNTEVERNSKRKGQTRVTSFELILAGIQELYKYTE